MYASSLCKQIRANSAFTSLPKTPKIAVRRMCVSPLKLFLWLLFHLVFFCLHFRPPSGPASRLNRIPWSSFVNKVVTFCKSITTDTTPTSMPASARFFVSVDSQLVLQQLFGLVTLPAGASMCLMAQSNTCRQAPYFLAVYNRQPLSQHGRMWTFGQKSWCRRRVT